MEAKVSVSLAKQGDPTAQASLIVSCVLLEKREANNGRTMEMMMCCQCCGGVDAGDVVECSSTLLLSS
eukprot:747233-Hanusia_phi.AAC.2